MPVNKRRFVDNARFSHFRPKVIAFTSTLTDAGKYRVAAVFGCNVMNQFHNQNGFTDARAAEKSDFTAARIRRYQVNDFNARLQNLRRSLLLFKTRRFSVNRTPFFIADRFGIVVDSLTQHVKDASQASFTDGNRNRCAGIFGKHSAYKSVS